MGFEAPIIFITGHADVPMTVRAMKAGAVEFLAKPFRDQELLDAIQHALDLCRQARRKQAAAAALRARLEGLTPREREVLALMAEGLSNSAIASQLVVTERAVAKHTSSIFVKLNLQPSDDDNRRVLAVLTYLGR